MPSRFVSGCFDNNSPKKYPINCVGSWMKFHILTEKEVYNGGV